MTVSLDSRFNLIAANPQERSAKLANCKNRFPRLLPPLEAKLKQYGEINFRTPQRLVSLLIDISSSMLFTPIKQINRGVADFVKDCCQDALTRDSLQVQLVTFGGPVKVYPFVPVTRFTPPTFSADGDTPLAEAILSAIAETQRYQQFLQEIQVETLKTHYFLFSDGQPNSSNLLEEAAACIHRYEHTRQGAFYGFGVDQAAVDALQPFFVRQVHLLSGQNFADFFRVISVSVRRVSSSCVSEDIDLTPLIKENLRILHEGNSDA
jgi:uncharacterized protein YegL